MRRLSFYWQTDLDTMQRRMEQLLEHLANTKPPLVQFSPRMWAPAIDVYETTDDVVVIVELAGVNQDELEMSLEGSQLTIRGHRDDTRPGELQGCYLMEIISGPFERYVTLPTTVDSEAATASYEGGLLKIVMPKAQRSLRVDIKAGPSVGKE